MGNRALTALFAAICFVLGSIGSKAATVVLHNGAAARILNLEVQGERYHVKFVFDAYSNIFSDGDNIVRGVGSYIERTLNAYPTWIDRVTDRQGNFSDRFHTQKSHSMEDTEITQYRFYAEGYIEDGWFVDHLWVNNCHQNRVCDPFGIPDTVTDRMYAVLTPVPIPAALPLFAGGLGLLGLLSWRRKRVVA